MTTAERLPDGRVWLQRDNGEGLILSAPEAQAILAAVNGQNLRINTGAQAHLARHKALRPESPAATWPASAKLPGAALGTPGSGED